MTRKVGVKALTLEDGDSICSVVSTDNDDVGMLTARGQFVICGTKEIRPIGRVAKGVKGITLNKDDEVVFATTIPKETKEIISISEKGYTKRTSRTEFSVVGRGAKGVKIHKLNDESDNLVAFLPIINETNAIVVANNSQIRIRLSEINLLSKGAQGVKSIKINDNSKVIGMIIF
jgi:DNA gyrase subunit A